MANHKKAEFTSIDQRISEVAKAMSHPARIAILRILAQHPKFTCGEIVEILPLSQPTVSHHLKELLTTDLITVINEGKKSLYEVNWNSWGQYTGEFGDLLSALQKK
ncbi:ArsR/SmtB family transcription factor [Mucilaginibacter sp. OK098]|uniref:ArsR/SmtB family transcription factor n=1 Tax=Mucilaginibacter sp. OK098 TaxID=1855297 RepID=UPI00090F247F|nr:metalloregulator ArsR/SmtB family transcription factor [Mucilaginibacter sp. OK098]SHN36791.1 ArsR family transcriptional regulator [Mucilaginibacter sp. OK098]